MPSKNSIKTYSENAYYHIYNRGVEKRVIFLDREDYSKFVYLLKIYLTPQDLLLKEYPALRKYIFNNNLSEEIDLLAFCLMPNHFHLLIFQKPKDAVTKLMRQLATAYSMYFNKRYERAGTLFQGVFKAAPVQTDEYLLHLSRYIHLNPTGRGASLDEFVWSSYLNYSGKKNDSWVKTDFIKKYFSNKNPNNTYQKFVEDYQETVNLPQEIAIEEP